MFYPQKGVTRLVNLITDTTVNVLALFYYRVSWFSWGSKSVLVPGEFWELRKAAVLIPGSVIQRIIALSPGA